MVVFSSLSTLCVFQWITLGWFRNSKSFGTACDISGRVQLKMTSRHQMSWKYIILSVCISLAASRFIKIIPADRGVNMEAIVIDQIIWHLLGCEPSEIRKCLHWSQWFGPPEWTWACLHFYLKVSCQTKLVQQIDRLCTDDQIGSCLKTEIVRIYSLDVWYQNVGLCFNPYLYLYLMRWHVLTDSSSKPWRCSM